MQYREGKKALADKEWGIGVVRHRWMLIIGAVLGGEICLLFERPGIGFGAYMILLTGLVFASRVPKKMPMLEQLMLASLIVGALQTARWTSLSNVLVMLTSLNCINGMTAHRGLSSRWMQWLEGWLVFFRPIGVIKKVKERAESPEAKRSDRVERIVILLKVVLPAFILLVVFGFLLSAGNAVLGNWIQGILAWTEQIFRYVEILSPGRIVIWVIFAWVGMALVYTARPTRISGLVTKQWKELGRSGLMIRGYQWFAVLLTMNLLFLFSSISDAVYLWMSRELPEGISHSRYLHHGVYVLMLTTVLSALVLGTLTQHAKEIRSSRFIQVLAHLWIVQNVILISGVFLRLRIYVEAFGHTPKRLYVILFLALVIAGFILLATAIHRQKTMKWLIGGNLMLLFCHFFILQLVDVPAMVMRWNLNLYNNGEIAYPEYRFMWQIGSHSIPYLINIHENSSLPKDRQRAIEDLKEVEYRFYRIENRPWQSFQYRDYVNWKVLEEFKDKHGSISD